MDKSILRQLADVRNEIRGLEQTIVSVQKKIDALEQDKAYAIVVGSREDLTIGPIKVRGHPKEYEEKIGELQKRKTLMEEKRIELLQMESMTEEYIQSINDSGLRQILRYRYIENLSWQQVAAQMRWKYSAESCRKKVERFMSG